jgi:hypothetical protein
MLEGRNALMQCIPRFTGILPDAVDMQQEINIRLLVYFTY